jgi:hypothetical protein
MPIVQLRTYTLKSASLAAAYAQRWKPTAASIAKLNVKTRGVFLSESNPKQVLAMIEFQDGDDPAKTIEQYVSSPAFKDDLGDELDKSDFEGVESQEMKEVKL